MWRGHVDSFSPATGAKYALIPAEPAAGNFTRVVQRVPVKIVLDGVSGEGNAANADAPDAGARPSGRPLGPRARRRPLTAERAVESERLGLRQLLIVFSVMLAVLLEIIDTSIVNTALPAMMGNLGATLDEIDWVITGYIISNVVVIPMTGWLASRFGRKRYFTISILLFTAASLALRRVGLGERAGVLARGPGARRRRAARHLPGDHGRDLPGAAAGHRRRRSSASAR